MTDEIDDAPNEGKRGRGRPPGSLNKRTRTLQEKMASLGFDPVTTLARIAMNNKNPAELRLKAASEAAPYIHAKLRVAEVALTGKDGGPLEVRKMAGLPDEDQETSRVLAFMFRSWQEKIKAAEQAQQAALPASEAPAQITYSKPSVLAALPTPDPAQSPVDPTQPALGYVEQVGDMFITLMERFDDGRERWSIRDGKRKLVGSAFSKDSAEAKARKMNEAGQ